MSTVTVLRLETRDGIGPYGECAAVEDMSDYAHRPRTDHDGMPHISDLRHMHFGFADIGALRAWFDDDALHYMDSRGVYVTTYEVQAGRVVRGNKQLCFNKDFAELRDVATVFTITDDEVIA